MIPHPLKNWLPARLTWRENHPQVEWCHLLNHRFTEPFLHQTVDRCMEHPFNLLFRQYSSLSELEELAAACPTPRLGGFIFHLTRCGSTLLARQLGAVPGSFALSEPRLLDSLVMAHLRNPEFTEADVVGWLRASVTLLALPRYEEDRQAWIKLGAVSTVQLALFRRAFPDVPWVFLYRDPVEVLVSLLNGIPGQMLPGSTDPRLLGLDLPAIVGMAPDEYCTLFLAQMCRAALENLDEQGLLVEYRELPEATGGRIAHHFGLRLGPEERVRLQEAAGWHAKTPETRWKSDAEAKQKAATPRIRELAARLQPLYQALALKTR